MPTIARTNTTKSRQNSAPPQEPKLEPNHQHRDGGHWLLLLALFVVGVFLRCYPIHEHVWVDELHTAWAALGKGEQFAQRVRLGNNGPVYFCLVQAIVNWLGASEWTLRFVSVVAGISLIPLTYLLVRSWDGSNEASLLATGLIAIDSHAVFYSVEARPYVVVQLMSLLHLFLFTKLLREKSSVWIWIGWVLSGILMFHLHCTSALIFVAEVVAFAILLFWRTDIKLNWIYFLLGLLLILVGMLPGIGLVREVAARRDNWSMFIERTRNPLRILWEFPLATYLFAPLVVAQVSFGVKRLRMRTASDEDDLDAMEQIEDENSQQQISVRICMVVALCWLFVPLVVAWVLTERDIVRLFFRRYLMASSVALAPLSALIVTRYFVERRLAFWGSCLLFLLGVSTISSARYIRHGTGALAHSAENWRTPVSIINASEDEETRDPVVLYSGLIEAAHWHDSEDLSQQAYCEFPIRGLYSIADDRKVISLPTRKPLDLSAAKIEKLREAAAQGFWLLVRGNDTLASDVQDEVLKVVGREVKVLETHDYGRVHLQRLGTTP